jgi:diamine N-acetyltransferase
VDYRQIIDDPRSVVKELITLQGVWYPLAVEKDTREIRVITNDPLESSVAIIRRAFGTVAEEMGLTEENAPTHPAFITVSRLEETRRKGAIFWGLFADGKQVGFVVVEKEPDGKYWMKRLAVLPEFRHGGSGKVLVDTAINYTRSKGEKKLYIAVAGDRGVLNDWYLAMGFKQTSVHKFDHLPFSVAFMELEI